MTDPRHTMVTIVAEAALERLVVEDLEAAGVSGFTTVEARGFGAHGQRHGDWDQNRSVRIETICEPETAAALAGSLLERWGKNYAIVVWTHDVEVRRSEKFETALPPEAGD